MIINEERMVKRFLDYVKTDSESFSERAFADQLKQDLTALGLSVSEDRAGTETGNLFVSVPGDAGAEPLLFTAHMDTVVPGKGIRPVLSGGVIRSEGDTILGADDKSGIAELLEALQVVLEEKLPHRPIELLFTVQEESGLTGSAGADLSRVRSKYSAAVDGCGPMEEIVVRGAGQANIRVTVSGKAAHAGNAPESGISASITAAKAISAMRLLKIDEETTANIGTVRADNPTNIVCSRLTFAAEVRSRDTEKLHAQVEHMRACVKKACEESGAEFVFEVTYPYQGFWVKDEAFLGLVKNAYARAGMSCTEGVTMVGSDSNILNEKGIAAIVLPSGMRDPHALTEHIEVSDMKRMAQVLLEMMRLP